MEEQKSYCQVQIYNLLQQHVLRESEQSIEIIRVIQRFNECDKYYNLENLRKQYQIELKGITGDDQIVQKITAFPYDINAYSPITNEARLNLHQFTINQLYKNLEIQQKLQYHFVLRAERIYISLGLFIGGLSYFKRKPKSN